MALDGRLAASVLCRWCLVGHGRLLRRRWRRWRNGGRRHQWLRRTGRGRARGRLVWARQLWLRLSWRQLASLLHLRGDPCALVQVALSVRGTLQVGTAQAAALVVGEGGPLAAGPLRCAAAAASHLCRPRLRLLRVAGPILRAATRTALGGQGERHASTSSHGGPGGRAQQLLRSDGARCWRRCWPASCGAAELRRQKL